MQLGLQASGGHPETCENNAGPAGGQGSCWRTGVLMCLTMLKAAAHRE